MEELLDFTMVNDNIIYNFFDKYKLQKMKITKKKLSTIYKISRYFRH